MKYYFDFDDFSPKNTQLHLLEEIKEHYPGFKATIFLVAWESRFGGETMIADEKYKPFCDMLIKEQDWLEVAVHGLTHKGRNQNTGEPAEFEKIDYEGAKKRIMVAEKLLLNRRIPYTKIFKAPFWLLSQRGADAVRDMEFKVAEDGYYNWNLKDEHPVWNDKPLVAHGHIQNTTGNGLEESLHRIMKMPPHSEFGFLSEYMNAEKVDPSKIDFRDPMERYELVEKKV